MYKQPTPPLAIRPALFLYSHLTSALNLLEHATWAFNTAQASSELDSEVFRRWVEEGTWGGNLVGIADEVKRSLEAPADRTASDTKMVYGEDAVKGATIELAKAHL